MISENKYFVNHANYLKKIMNGTLNMKRKVFRIIINIGLVAASFLFTFAAILFACKLYIKMMNIKTPSYLYESKIDMFAYDPLVGYVNKPNFSSFCFGNIPVRTNNQGFRCTHPISVAKNAGVTRIFGVGDSIIWGMGVKQEDSIMGLLDQKLNRDKPCEVINAGVIGYSTYQEVLFFEKFILPLKPDIVIINYCINDVFYTEDPYSNLFEIYASYLNTALKDQSLTYDEKINLEKLLDILELGEKVFYASNSSQEKLKQLFGLANKNSPFDYFSVPGIMKVFLEMPITRLAERCHRENIRLIYLFIPPAWKSKEYKVNVNFLKQLLTEKGAEFIDLQSALKPPKEILIYKNDMIFFFLEKLLPHEILQVLEDLVKQRVHKRDFFFDFFHTTRKGNEIIAECIYQYLIK
jgi:lysophospholipase L1-like esterase